MNVGKSIKMALVKVDKKQTWLAEQLGISSRQVNKVANNESASGKTIEKMAEVFGMKVSDFLALGEE